MERDRFLGCLAGLAVGDALGTTVEFRPPGSFPPVRDMTGGGPFNLRPGQWTDETSMTRVWPRACSNAAASMSSSGVLPRKVQVGQDRLDVILEVAKVRVDATPLRILSEWRS